MTVLTPMTVDRAQVEEVVKPNAEAGVFVATTLMPSCCVVVQKLEL